MIPLLVLLFSFQDVTVFQRGSLVSMASQPSPAVLRVIGVPGDRVRIEAKGIFINDVETAGLSPYFIKAKGASAALTLAAGQYYVVGEEGTKRFWGRAPAANLAEALPDNISKSDEGRRLAMMKFAIDKGNEAMRSKDFEKAIEQFEYATELDTNEEIFSSLAEALAALSDYTASIDAFKKAIALKPDPQYYAGLVISYFYSGKVDDAIASAKKAAELDKINGSIAYYYLGALYWNSGARPTGCKAFQEAVALNPENAPARNQLRFC